MTRSIVRSFPDTHLTLLFLKSVLRRTSQINPIPRLMRQDSRNPPRSLGGIYINPHVEFPPRFLSPPNIPTVSTDHEQMGRRMTARPHPLLWVSLILSLVALVMEVPKGSLPTLTGRHRALRVNSTLISGRALIKDRLDPPSALRLPAATAFPPNRSARTRPVDIGLLTDARRQTRIECRSVDLQTYDVQ